MLQFIPLSITILIKKNILNIIIVSLLCKVSNMINYLLINETKNNNKYKDELEKLDIELKLNIISKWLINNNNNKLYTNSLLQICIILDDIMDKINIKIKYHNNKLFSKFRILNIDNEINELMKYIFILNNRLLLFNFI
jgi:hypothetical protein